MCFGPVASFTAGAFLASIGTAVLKNVRRRKELWFAAFPLLFAVQQMTEGFLWLVLKKGGPENMRRPLTFIFLVFAYSLWPVLCPVSVYAIEYDKRRRKILRFFIFLGVLTSAYLLFYVFKNSAYVSVVDHHIRYHTFVNGYTWFTGIYILVTLFPYFISSQRAILWFGGPNLIFCAAAFILYRVTFISVWCFFAALISINLYISLRKLHHEPVLSPK
jgi:hypothetical protein